MAGVADNIRRLLGQNMCNWKTVLTSNGDTLSEVSIQRGIFEGDSLSRCHYYSHTVIYDFEQY